jgi:hypothetical protein
MCSQTVETEFSEVRFKTILNVLQGFMKVMMLYLPKILPMLFCTPLPFQSGFALRI